MVLTMTTVAFKHNKIAF